MAEAKTFVSDWHSIEDIDKFLDYVVIRGDILECQLNDGSKHYAVYNGLKLVDDKKKPFIIHCWPDCCNDELPNSSLWDTLLNTTDSKDGVDFPCCEVPFQNIIFHFTQVRVMNQLDSEWEPYNPDDILNRGHSALSSSGTSKPKKFISCKHFAVWCRYDENYLNSLAETTRDTASTIKTCATVGVFGALTAGLSYLFYSQCKVKAEIDDKDLKDGKKGKKSDKSNRPK